MHLVFFYAGGMFMSKYLIIGNGFIGNKFLNFLEDCEMSTKMIYSYADALDEIKEKAPKVVINCAGETGRPNVDWCEDNKQKTFDGNVLLPLNLAKACEDVGTKLVHIGTGCVYVGDNNGEGFSEKDEPNFGGSFYSQTKMISESLLKDYDVLQLRIRMPIDSAQGPRNFITKITNYKQVIDIKNSMTVIDDLLAVGKDLIEKNKPGIYNVVNPGPMSHSEILEIYKKIVDPNFSYEIISLEELHKMTKAKRSNCVLNTEKLEREIKIPTLKEQLTSIMHDYK
jgi:3,5-epimerase/4-reductase